MLAIQKAGLSTSDIRYVFAGDLLEQNTATSYGIKDLDLPLFGLFGACSTVGEALSLAAMTVAGGFAQQVLATASSHIGTAEKQFRFPLEYGNQRPLSATWTVTGAGAFIVSEQKKSDKNPGNHHRKDCGLWNERSNEHGGRAWLRQPPRVIYQHFQGLFCISKGL